MARSACFVPVLSTKRVSFMDTGLSINNILRTQRDQMETAFFNVFDTFTYECGEKNAWTKSTHEKMAALTRFVVYLRDEKKLYTPRKPKGEEGDSGKTELIGFKNSSIDSERHLYLLLFFKLKILRCICAEVE